jgi:hypothetical protein
VGNISHALAPLHTKMLRDDETRTSRPQLNGHIFEAEFKGNTRFGPGVEADTVEYGYMLVCRRSVRADDAFRSSYPSVRTQISCA